MRYTVKFLFIILIFVIQSTWAQYIDILGVTPNILMAAVVAVALVSEPIEAAVLAIFAGALFDLMYGRVFGISTLLYMYIAIMARVLLEYMYEKTIISTIFITFLAVLMYQSIYFFLSFVIWGEGGFLYLFFRVMVPCAAYTACLQVIIYAMVNKLPCMSGVRGGRT